MQAVLRSICDGLYFVPVLLLLTKMTPQKALCHNGFSGA